MMTSLTHTRRRTRIAFWGRRILPAIAIAALATTGAHADPHQRSTTGKMLLQFCLGPSADTTWCDAYITGVVESIYGSSTLPARCFKDRPQLGDMKKVIVDYVEWSRLEGDDYPLRRPAPLVIQQVLTVKYCG